MRPYRDRPDILVSGRWHWCAPGAKTLPFPHAFGSAAVESEAYREDPPIGEIWYYGGTAVSPANPRYIGQNWCGSAEEWAHGTLYSQRGTPTVDVDGVPRCCISLPLPQGGGAGQSLSEPRLETLPVALDLWPLISPYIPAAPIGLRLGWAGKVMSSYHGPAPIGLRLGWSARVVGVSVGPAPIGLRLGWSARLNFPLQSGLVAWWGCHEPAGNPRLDSSGNGHTMFEAGGPVASVPGLIGDAASFTGGSYLASGFAAWTSGPFSISLWANNNPVGFQPLFGQDDLPSTVFMSQTLSQYEGGVRGTNLGSGAFVSSAWNHVVWRYDGVRLKIYVNQILKAVAVVGAVVDGGVTTWLGRYISGAIAIGSNLQLVGVWPRALLDGGATVGVGASQEISQLFNGGMGLDWPL